MPPQAWKALGSFIPDGMHEAPWSDAKGSSKWKGPDMQIGLTARPSRRFLFPGTHTQGPRTLPPTGRVNVSPC